ncbi:MAG: hypothetical protein LBN05_00375 [Oscillospiraceae bacterium]|jgi:hypothetical protein|nr:hypothetical protein [Oscillospiraceae bacterium]
MARDESEWQGWQSFGVPLRDDVLFALQQYASAYGIKMDGFENTDVDADLIREALDDCAKVIDRFPELGGTKEQPFTLRAREMPDTDFAETRKSAPFVISINASAFRSKERLESEYARLAEQNWFVHGTDYRSIIFHEFGHLYSFMHRLSGVRIMKKVSEIHHKKDVLQFICDNLSEYAATGSGEITAEAFSAYFGKKDPGQTVLTFIAECVKLECGKEG